jgi:hypothetical protein
VLELSTESVIENFSHLLLSAGQLVPDEVVGKIVRNPHILDRARNCATPADALALLSVIRSIVSTHAKNEIVDSIYRDEKIQIGIDGPLTTNVSSQVRHCRPLFLQECI